ncbi:MAG: nucleoside deaminase [Rickettsiales bacterium]|nr:nucleoside deaminase [Rickettsiales bacterium]
MFDYQKFMKIALSEAQIAASKNEVPVGALLVKDNQIIAKAHNSVEASNDATNHAELLIIKQASQILGSKNLENTSLYVTLEPCLMCATAISYARISKIIFGAEDKKLGAIENGDRIFYNSKNNLWKPEIIGSIMAEESEILLKNFFKNLR